MTNYLSSASVREVVKGALVTYSWTLPASATTNTLFTVTGGNILVTAMIGQVTTVIGSTATTLSLGTGPSGGGTAEHTGIATAAAITSSEVGVWVAPGVSAVASNIIAPAELAVGSFAGFTPTMALGFPVATGTITATTSANAGGGVINWYLTYIALDNGAYVTAA